MRYFIKKDNDVFDFSRPIGQQYRGTYYGDTNAYLGDFIIQKDKALLSYQWGREQTPNKIVYNLDNPPIYERKKVFNPKILENNSQNYLYITRQQLGSKDQKQCPIAFLTTSNILYKYKDCEPFAVPQQFTIDPKYYLGTNSARITLTKDNKSIILIYYLKFGQKKIQIRSIRNPAEIIYQEETAVEIFDIALTEDNFLLYNSYDVFYIKSIGGSHHSDKYGLQKFSMMDANEMGCSVFSGVLKDNLNVIRILSKNKTETDFSHVDIEAQNITILKTSKNCRYFCTYTENENLTIWQTVQKGIKLKSTISMVNITSLKFFGEDKILLELGEILAIWSINQENEVLKRVDSNMGNKLIYDGSSDGRFIAAVKNNSKVQIMTEKSDLIAEFIPDSPSDQIFTSLTCSEDNSLYISSNQKILYKLSPQLCPKNEYAQQLRCYTCDFPCSQCHGPGNSCINYQSTFYVLISACILTFTLIVSLTVWFITSKQRRRKLVQNENEKLSEPVLQSVECNNQ